MFSGEEIINNMMLPNSYVKCCDYNNDDSPQKPTDLSIKRKIRPVPPPLDLSKRNLCPYRSLFSPSSPFAQKNLPLRKRAFNWSSQPNLNHASNIDTQTSMRIAQLTDNFSLTKNAKNCDNFNQSSVQSNIFSSNNFKLGFLPTPKTSYTPHPHSASPVFKDKFNFSENLENVYMLDSYLEQLAPLNLSTKGIPSILLSPASSYPSTPSLSSSREELEYESFATDKSIESNVGITSLQDVGTDNSFIQSLPTTVWSIFLSGVQIKFVSNENAVSEAKWTDELGQLECTVNQKYGPNGLCLLEITPEVISNPGCDVKQIYFQLFFRPNGVQQEDILVLVPSYHPFYVQDKGWCSLCPDLTNKMFNLHCFLISTGSICLNHSEVPISGSTWPVSGPLSMIQHSLKGAITRPLNTLSEPLHSPISKIQQPAETLMLGSTNSPMSVVQRSVRSPILALTPGLSDAMRYFDFSDKKIEARKAQAHRNYDKSDSKQLFHVSTNPRYEKFIGNNPSNSGLSTIQKSLILSPPNSPSKKSKISAIKEQLGIEKNADASTASGAKSRRPMNGFMLFGKCHRIKLIQTHPGKDNRAISVLLGNMWKGLPEKDRKNYKCQAKLQAEEMKRIDPDCWKRRRSKSIS